MYSWYVFIVCIFFCIYEFDIKSIYFIHKMRILYFFILHFSSECKQ